MKSNRKLGSHRAYRDCNVGAYIDHYNRALGSSMQLMKGLTNLKFFQDPLKLLDLAPGVK